MVITKDFPKESLRKILGITNNKNVPNSTGPHNNA